jgi:triosephosphate isomerase
MAARRPLIAGNWKMNGLRADGIALAAELVGKIAGAGKVGFDLLICPPFTLIGTVAKPIGGSPILLGAQDCHVEASGAHTGDISAAMLADAGCTHVIVGHSERRQNHFESNELVLAKARAAHAAGLVAIICVGEIEAERDAGNAEQVVAEQLAGSIPEGATAANTVIAYEPVWAIGTGRTPTPEDVAAMHAAIRGQLDGLVDKPAAARILYGGSVKASNAEVLLGVDNVDGALVGGASLKGSEFWAIAEASGA